jgi:ABC-type sulfate/molybdate transport systems ATPase subunit
MLKVIAIVKSHGDARVLDGVHLSLGQGAIGAITGPSGAGKTTLLHLIAGLDRPDRGAILWQGRELSSAHAWQPPWARPVAVAFQHFGLWPHIDVAGHLDLVVRVRKDLSRSDRRATCERWLSRLQLSDLAHRYPGELSGGQQQRVAIARSLARAPQLLLMDEPFAFLDGTTAQVAWDAVSEWRDESGGTLLVVTHDLDWIARFATQRFVLDESGLREHPTSALDRSLRVRDEATV